MEKGREMKPFHYRNLGSMATVGRNRAVAEFSKVKMQGWFAWVMWLVVHLRSILGVRNKVIVLLNWVWNYFTYDQSMRMIVYARKAKEIRDREKVEETTHWGKELVQEERTPHYIIIQVTGFLSTGMIDAILNDSKFVQGVRYRTPFVFCYLLFINYL